LSAGAAVAGDLLAGDALTLRAGAHPGLGGGAAGLSLNHPAGDDLRIGACLQRGAVLA